MAGLVSLLDSKPIIDTITAALFVALFDHLKEG